MRVTTDHTTSNYGVPVILDDAGEPMDYAPGIKAARRALGLTAAALAELCGKSTAAVNQWEQGRRMPPTEALNVLSDLLSKAALTSSDG